MICAWVQRRREFPTRATQAMQVLIQNSVIGRVLESGDKLSPPLFLRLLELLPLMRRILARLLGLGVRPEPIGLPVPA
jgi:hypothetical protein